MTPRAAPAAPGVPALERAPRRARHHRRCASCSPTTPAAGSGSSPRPPGCTSTTRRTSSPTRRSGCSSSSPRVAVPRAARRDVRAASTSTSRRTAPCCTSRCACRKGATLVVDGVDVVAEVHDVLDAHGRVLRPGALRRAGSGHTGERDPQRREHRDRRLGPRPGHGLRGAARTTRRATSRSASSPTSTRPTSSRRSRDLDPDETLFIVVVQDVRHPRDAHQRDVGAGVAARRPRRRGGGREALRRGLDERRARGRVRDRHGEHVRLLGLGRRPLLDGLGDRAVHDARDRPRALRASCSPGSTRWTSTSAPRRSTGTSRCSMALLAVWYVEFFGVQVVRRACPTTST